MKEKQNIKIKLKGKMDTTEEAQKEAQQNILKIIETNRHINKTIARQQKELEEQLIKSRMLMLNIETSQQTARRQLNQLEEPIRIILKQK